MRTDPTLRFSSDYKPSGLDLPGRLFQDGVSQSGKERNHLFLWDGDGFRDLAAISGADSIADGRAVALLDFDRDGWLDLALVNANAPLFEMFRNRMSETTVAAPPGFIALRFVGGNHAPRAASTSNRDGYGAVVRVIVDGATLLREHRAGEGMAAQNSSTMLVGLGGAAVADEVVVRWPSGAVTRTSAVPRGTLLTARETAPDGGELFTRGDYRARSPGRTSGPSAAELRDAIDRGAAYFGREVTTADPSWISLFGFLERRFGLEVRLASGVAAHEVRDGVARGEVFEVYRRIDDPGAAIEKQQIADLEHVVDRITASALHCDRIALPDNWIEILGNATRAGGYALTHAVLATEWTVENDCVGRSATAELHDEQVRRLVELVDRRGGLAAKFDSSTDLWIEAIAMLDYAGAAQAVRPEWIRDVLAAQLPSGGWPKAPGAAADPHTSALALWVLLERVEDSRPGPWIAPSRPSKMETN